MCGAVHGIYTTDYGWCGDPGDPGGGACFCEIVSCDFDGHSFSFYL